MARPDDLLLGPHGGLARPGAALAARATGALRLGRWQDPFDDAEQLGALDEGKADGDDVLAVLIAPVGRAGAGGSGFGLEVEGDAVLGGADDDGAGDAPGHGALGQGCAAQIVAAGPMG